MLGPRTGSTLRSVAAMVLGALIVLALPHPSRAQQPAVSAELKRVVGRVELLRKGQTQWIPAVIGAHLVEGDDIRAFSGAWAELALPDRSTVTLGENSRLLLAKLEFDRQSQSRTVLLHLAVGKLRAAIAQASISLVRLRQSSFAISTPTAVAAARGTIVWAWHALDPGDPGARYHTYFAVEPEKGVLQPSRVDCIPLRGGPAGGPLKAQKSTAIFAGSQSLECGPTKPIDPQLTTLSNPDPAGAFTALANAPVFVPPGVLEAVTADLTTAAISGVSFDTTGGLGIGSVSFPSTGRDVQVNQEQSLNAQQNVQPLSAR
jgi:FecR protein